MKEIILNINTGLIQRGSRSTEDFKQELKRIGFRKPKGVKYLEELSAILNPSQHGDISTCTPSLDHYFVLDYPPYRYVFSQPYAYWMVGDELPKPLPKLSGYETYVVDRDSQYNPGNTALVVYRRYR